MATTVGTKGVVATGTGERVGTRAARGTGLDGSGKRTGGGGKPYPPGGGGDERARDETLPHYRIGMWVAVATILMLFMALTSAYVFRAAVAGWEKLQTPSWLWVSTAVILASSVVFELARKSAHRDDRAGYRRWLVVVIALGFVFLASQLLAWRELVAQGVYLATNPHSSFFYVLSSLHGLHFLGGICGLCFLLVKSRRATLYTGEDERVIKLRRSAAADAVGIYWHFMDGLWVYLFVLLFLWR
ncbi:MAG: cytochrome c oxidase subunit [Acidobacteriota bacterium]|nr:cytochrome c oxidase subunit [Acidobacteriota bacterium]